MPNEFKEDSRSWRYYLFEGKWLTVGQLAQIAWYRYDNWINTHTLRCRIRRGIPIDEALRSRPRCDRYFVNGNWCRMSDLKRMAEEKGLNLPESTILNRLKRGWSIEDTISTPPLPKKKFKLYLYKGRLYPIKELAKMAFVSYNTLRVAIRKKPHLSVEEIIDSYRIDLRGQTHD